MESGEKELRQAFEEVTTNNVKAVVEHTNETRQIVRELEKRVEVLEKQHKLDLQTIEALRGQISHMQDIVYSGGT